MELFLQFGYGMMGHCIELCSDWGGGTIILSPRDIKPEWLESQAEKMGSTDGVRLLLDPQWYVPHTNHERLKQHEFLPEDYDSGSFFDDASLTGLAERVVETNNQLGTEAVIVPGLVAGSIDQIWLTRHKAINDAFRDAASDRRRYVTISLAGECVRSAEQIHELLDSVPDWGADGAYVVLQHPDAGYFVEDPLWLANALDLVAGLRLAGLYVVVGYCNQQSLIAASAGANAIASGTWRNVRVFPPEKFFQADEDERRQRATWYYCPQSLSEFKVAALDIAKLRGVLGDMAPEAGLDKYCSVLFGEAMPTSVAYGEPESFRHYLHCLRSQVMESRKETFEETLEYHLSLLDGSESLLRRLHDVAVRADDRDITAAINMNRGALGILNDTRGAVLEREWERLS